MVFSCWIQNVLESCPNNVYYVAYSPPSTASVSDVLQILFLEDGLPAFYSAKTQDVLLSVRSLIDDLMLAMDLYQRKEKWFSNNSPLRVKLCFWNFFPNITFINTNVSKQNVLNKRNWHPLLSVHRLTVIPSILLTMIPVWRWLFSAGELQD